MSNFLFHQDLPRFKRVLAAFEAGGTAREVCQAEGIAKETAHRIQKAVWAEAKRKRITIMCPCGLKAGHHGWCSHRLKRSPARQAFLKRWQEEARARNNLRNELD